MFSFFRRSRKDPKESSGAKADAKKEKKNRTTSASNSTSDESTGSQCPTPATSVRAIPASTESGSLFQSVKSSIPAESTGLKNSDASLETKLTIPDASTPVSASAIPAGFTGAKSLEASVKPKLTIPDAPTPVSASAIPAGFTEAKSLETSVKPKLTIPGKSAPVSASPIPDGSVSEKAIPLSVESALIKNEISDASAEVKTLISDTPKLSIPEQSVKPKVLEQSDPVFANLIPDGVLELNSTAEASSSSKITISNSKVNPKLSVLEKLNPDPSLLSVTSIPVESAPKKSLDPDTSVIPKSTVSEKLIRDSSAAVESSGMKVSIPDTSVKPTFSVLETSSIPDEQINPVSTLVVSELNITAPNTSAQSAILSPDVSAPSANADVGSMPISLSGESSPDPNNNPECRLDSTIRTAKSRVKHVHFAPLPHYDTPSPPTDANLHIDFDRLSGMDDQAEAETVLQLRQQLEEKSRRLEELEEAIFQAAGQRSTSTTPLTALEQFELDMKERELIDNERDEELRLLQEALEEALEEKAELESQLLQDGSRQTQMLDDFEWKLGEIERDYKKKIAETEKTVEERVKNDMTAQHQQLIDDKNTIDEKLSEIAHLKSYEAEVTQLRGLIHEQQRALRVASRQVDQLRVSERMLSDDVSKMRTQGYTRKQQQEMEHKWEEKMQAECKRLRHELQLRAEEEQLRVIAQVTRDKEDQVTNAKRQSDAMQLKLNSQMAELRMTIEKKDAELRKQMESSRTLADRQMCDFRHKMSKLQDSHQEIVDSLEHKHAQEIEQCQRIAVDKETQEREFEEKLRSTETQHQTQLNALQDLIEEEKQEALTDLGDHYRSQLQDLQEHIIALQHKLVEAERKKNEEIARLKAKLISDHEGEVQTLQKKLEELQTLRKQLEGQSQNSASSSSAGEETDEEEEQQQPEDEEEEEEDEDEEEEEEEEEEEDEEEEEEEETDEDEESEDTPPIGRSAGDGCSPSNSRDQLRSCKEEIASPVLMFDVETQAELLNYEFYCNDPDHVDAHTIILEMHQILADRDAELQRLTEEKRFYQLELIHWERNLSHQRAGLPLMLIPDNFANASAQLWKGFSAPPMTKPRLIDHPIIPPVLSRSGSYEIFSDSASASQADVQAARSTHSHSIFEDEDDYRSEMSGRSNSGFVTPF